MKPLEFHSRTLELSETDITEYLPRIMTANKYRLYNMEQSQEHGKLVAVLGLKQGNAQ